MPSSSLASHTKQDRARDEVGASSPSNLPAGSGNKERSTLTGRHGSGQTEKDERLQERHTAKQAFESPELFCSNPPPALPAG